MKGYDRKTLALGLRRTALILTASASLAFAGCSNILGWLGLTEDKPAASVKVGATLPGGSNRWSIEAAEMRAAAKGAHVVLTIDQTALASSDQINYFKARVAGGDKVILVTAIDSLDAGWDAALQAAKVRGVTVVAYDRGLDDADLYYSFDNAEIGRMQGAWLVGKVPAGAYYLLRGASTDPNSALFANGALDIIEAASPAISLINPLAADQTVADWLPNNANSMVGALLLSQVPDAILAPNDGTAGGAAAAIAASSIPDAAKASLLGALTGQDGSLEALKRIDNGQQGMTIVKNYKNLARYAMTIAAALGDDSSVASIATGTVGGTPSFLVTHAVDPDAVFVVDGANLKAKADAGLLDNTWADITAP